MIPQGPQISLLGDLLPFLLVLEIIVDFSFQLPQVGETDDLLVSLVQFAQVPSAGGQLERPAGGDFKGSIVRRECREILVVVASVVVGAVFVRVDRQWKVDTRFSHSPVKRNETGILRNHKLVRLDHAFVGPEAVRIIHHPDTDGHTKGFKLMHDRMRQTQTAEDEDHIGAKGPDFVHQPAQGFPFQQECAEGEMLQHPFQLAEPSDDILILVGKMTLKGKSATGRYIEQPHKPCAHSRVPQANTILLAVKRIGSCGGEIPHMPPAFAPRIDRNEEPEPLARHMLECATVIRRPARRVRTAGERQVQRIENRMDRHRHAPRRSAGLLRREPETHQSPH